MKEKVTVNKNEKIMTVGEGISVFIFPWYVIVLVACICGKKWKWWKRALIIMIFRWFAFVVGMYLVYGGLR